MSGLGIDLTGRRVLVTGGSRGIGAACCRLFARAGAAVLVHYTASDAAAGRLVEELRQISERRHCLFRADVRDPRQVERMLSFAGAEWGGLDHLVANAGIWQPTPIGELDLERTREIFDTNLTGVFATVARAVPLLSAASASVGGDGEASIVTIASTAAQRGEAGYSAYAASKGALVAATKSWAVELAPRVRVNAVAPGWVETDMTRDVLDRETGRITGEIPRGRVAAPEEVAGPVLFLASSLARHVTGEVLNVNGGSVLVG